MSAEPTIKDVINAVSSLGGSLDKMDARLGKTDSRLDKLDSRFDKLDSHLDKLNSRLDKLDSRLDKLDSKLGAINDRLDAVEQWQKRQPDLRLLMANSKVAIDKFVQIEGELRMLRSAINDHARENVTPGEMAAVHADLDLYRHAQIQTEIRIQRLETVLALQPE